MSCLINYPLKHNPVIPKKLQMVVYPEVNTIVEVDWTPELTLILYQAPRRKSLNKNTANNVK